MIVDSAGHPKAAVYSWAVLSSAGTAILFASLCSIPVMGASFSTAAKVFVATLKQLKWPIVSVSFVLGFAYVMNFSGMAVTLGTAFASTGKAFPFFAPFLGWLGVFMTGSDTSANALFGKLQQVTAEKIGVNPIITVAANTSGGVSGKMISPQSLAVACAAVGIVGKESEIFRFTVKHSIILTTAIAAMIYLQSNVLGFLVPPYAKAAAPAAVSVVATSVPSSGIPHILGMLALVALVSIIARVWGKPSSDPQPSAIALNRV
jgi:lactate permease